MSRDRESEIIEVWKAVINVQVHFNDIAMRIRGMFVTIILALFASLGFLLDKKIGLLAGNVVIQFAVIVPIFGVLGTYLFYFMDRYWYHRLLIGAVKQGVAIEQLGLATLPELNLTKAIGDESPYQPRGMAKVFARLVVSHAKLKATGMLHSDGKLEFFYKSVMIALACTSLLIAIMGGVEFKDNKAEQLTKSSADQAVNKVPSPSESQGAVGGLALPLRAAEVKGQDKVSNSATEAKGHAGSSKELSQAETGASGKNAEVKSEASTHKAHHAEISNQNETVQVESHLDK